jgi:hypothetical protein
LNKKFDFELYFDELASHGLNHSRVFSGAYREVESSFGITDNTLSPSHADYICPWARVEKTHEDGAPIFDLERWDEHYFERLHSLVEAASKRGIVLELTLFCPMYNAGLWEVNPMRARNNVNGVGTADSKHVYTTEHLDLLNVQTRLAEKIVRELAPYDNLYYEVCNEPYVGSLPEEWQSAIVDAIVSAQEEIGCRKLISWNIANKTKKVESPNPHVSIFNFHYCHPPVVVAENSHLRGVIGENETGFRGSADFLYRTEGWDFLLAGGGLYNSLDYSFTATHPSGTLTGYKSPGGGSRELRRQLGVLKRAMDSLPLPNVAPQPDFAQADAELVVSALGQAANSYLVYTHVRLPGSIKQEPIETYLAEQNNVRLQVDLPLGRYQVTQINTQSGDEVKELVINVESEGEKSVIPLNAFQTDAAVLIRRVQP